MEVKGCVTFCQSDFRSTSFTAFEDMRKNGELCDFKVITENKEITAHRVVVAAGIPYFRSTLAGDVDKEITVPDIDPRALESLIDFAYSSEIIISGENVSHLLFASKFLRLENVVEGCVEFLSKRLDVNNVWQVRKLALNLDITRLIEISNLYVLANIEKLSRSVEFLDLPHSHLIEILFKNDLDSSSEKNLFDAVIDWVKVSPAERQAVLPELMGQIRLVYLPIEYLAEKAASEEVIRTCTISRDMIDEVKNYHFFPKNKSLFPNVKTNPRQFIGLYCICQDHSNVFVRYFDFVNHMWHIVSRSEKCGDVLHTVAVSEKMYIFCVNQMNIFNTKTLEWRVIFHEWYNNIWNTAVATIGNMIYCFGSSVGGFHNSIWCFDADENMLLKTGSMKRMRWNAAAATLQSETECVYVTGGGDIHRLNSVEKYCPSRNECCEVSSMLSKRALHSAASINGKLYVCGGSDDNHALNSSEMYDPVVDRWTSLSLMNSGRPLLSLVVHKSKLYALTGTTVQTDCNRKAEIFCLERNKWESAFLIPEGFKKAVVI